MDRRALFIFVIGVFLFAFRARSQSPVIICASKTNDIVTILKDNAIPYRLYSDPATAVCAAAKGSGVMLLADGHPAQRLRLPESIFRLAKSKRLRLYVEYPESLPGIKMEDSPIPISIERGIITTSAIPGLDSLDLLGIHNGNVIPVKVPHSLIALGKVAGFDKAIYGISDISTCPLLFRQGNMMVATVPFSHCITARFGPSVSWQKIWRYILSWLDPRLDVTFRHWPLQVSPMYSQEEKLPGNAMMQSVRKGGNWFYKARFFVDPSWEKLFLRRTGNGTDVVGPPVSRQLPVGDGSLGVLEGQVSHINDDGSQPYRWWIRADDQAGVAYALALAGKYLKEGKFTWTADNLLNYLFVRSDLCTGPRDDSTSPSFGLIGWATTQPGVYYGDDNARTILSAIGASAALHTDQWNTYIIRAILGNFSTSGKNGFRGNVLEDASLQAKGWRYFAGRNIINVRPHYEAWLWACYLWLYSKTGYKPLLSKAESASRITMDSLHHWHWTNSLLDEKARMILPLAWLIRVDNTPEHRAWLKEVAGELLANLQPCGAIREKIGDSRYGSAGPPSSNKAYGSAEASLISKNGDPAVDLLYTENFAFFALNEAACATGDTVYRNAVRRIADFLIRIQVKSKVHPDLDGAWFRAFDYRLWDYWASNSDWGWGAWSTQTGWTQTWILSTLVLMQRHSSFWDETKYIHIRQQAEPIIREMLDKEP